jgi:hypothetical protein
VLHSRTPGKPSESQKPRWIPYNQHHRGSFSHISWSHEVCRQRTRCGVDSSHQAESNGISHSPRQTFWQPESLVASLAPPSRYQFLPFFFFTKGLSRENEMWNR